MATALRTEDLLRHLADLRSGSHEGVSDRAGKQAVYRRAVELLDPVVRRVLEEARAALLDGDGEVAAEPVHPDGGGLLAAWTLSWPAQRASGTEPVTVVAEFAAGFLHPHLRGGTLGWWPLQVTGERDAERQVPVVAAIVEAELHNLVLRTSWRVVPAAHA